MPNTNIPPVVPSSHPPAPPPAVTYEDDTFEEAPTGLDLEATPMEHDAADDEGTIAERIARRRRATAAVVAPDLLANPDVPYVIYLCSGAECEDNLAAHLQKGGLHTIQIDYERGGMGHDLARSDVADRAVELASNNLCVAVFASPP
eukprot:5037875-Pleurochrysis_carterae.AAC.1